MPRFYELSECTAMLRKTASIYRGVPLVSHSNFWIIWLCWDPNLGCGEFWRDPLLSCKRVKVRCRASPRKMWDSLSGFVLFFFLPRFWFQFCYLCILYFLWSMFDSFVFAVSATADCWPPPPPLLLMAALMARAQKTLPLNFPVTGLSLAGIQMSLGCG